MSDHRSAHFAGPENLEALTADREKMWHGFTSATTGLVIFMIVLLALMGLFLL
jgi:hypothetical protein